MRWLRRAADDEAADQLERAINNPRSHAADPGLLGVARALRAASDDAPVSPRAEWIRGRLIERGTLRSRALRPAAVALIAIAVLALGIGSVAAAPAVGDAVLTPIRTVIERLLGDHPAPPPQPTEAPFVSPSDPIRPPVATPSAPQNEPGPESEPPGDGPPSPFPTPALPTFPPGDGPPSPFPTPPLPDGVPPPPPSGL